MGYFRDLINRELNRPLTNTRPDDLARVFAQAARTADGMAVPDYGQEVNSSIDEDTTWLGLSDNRPNHWDADCNSQIWLTDGKSLPVLCPWQKAPEFGYWKPTGLKRQRAPFSHEE
jgi:hypothetical protein